MKKSRIAVCLVLISAILMQLGWFTPVFAAPDPPQPEPKKLRVEAPVSTDPAIGNSQFDGYYADLKSDKQDMPVGTPAVASVYLNYYLQEVNKPYKPVKPSELKVGNIPANTGADNVQRMKELNSGTVYYAFSRAYYTYTAANNATITSPESIPSNTVKFLTDIEINAYSYGPNQIKIEWDDVWNSGKRMDYKLYVSENKDFSNTPPIYIGQDQIEPNGPITVNQATGKLEYIYTVRDPGRVYYIKVAPDTNEAGLAKSAESPVVAVSSYILAKTTKMSTADYGTIWKLEWSPVVTGIGDSSIKISYQIYKGDVNGGNIEQYMASVDDTVFFLTVQPDDVSSYYVIKASVTRNGQDVYPGIRIQSEKIYVKESDIPAVPGVPEIVDKFTNGTTDIITYQQNLHPDSATILWRAPLKGDGSVDSDVSYDIWLVTDPNLISNPPSSMMVASSLKMSDSNFVSNGTTLLGYKYPLSGLSPNSTYYFIVVAKKSYVEFVDNELQTVVKTSQPAMKIMITPTGGPIDQPVVPARPPLKVKTAPNGLDMISGTSVTIQLPNKWYEEYMPAPQGGSSYWQYVTPDKLKTDSGDPNIIDKLDGKNTLGSPPDTLKYRKVEYDSGVTIDVGCVQYSPDTDYTNPDNLPTNRIIGVPTAPNDPDEDVHAPNAPPDGLKHNIDIPVGGLDSNTTYVLWVKAARRSVDLISGPSDLIIITTIPDIGGTLEKPTVPVFNYSKAGDTYVDLGWNFNYTYTYHIKYSTKDDISTAGKSVDVTPDDLKYASYYRVSDLDTNTLYYFWIQAESSNEAGDTDQSVWSDSLPVKTLPDTPPPTPKGFGVKSTDNAVTKDSITYEWLEVDGMSYVLEIASDIDYKDVKTYEIKEGVTELTVASLRSNFRYYARLYAYDPKKDLRSEPTQSITVRTKRSTNDYDSNEDIENVISGDFIDKDPAPVNHVWNISITGANAARFTEYVQTDNLLDYSIDLRSAPAGTDSISLLVSGEVLKAMSMLGENLLLQSDRNTLVIRPGMIDTGKQGSAGTDPADLGFKIIIALNSSTSGSNISNLSFKTPIAAVDINVAEGNRVRPLKQLDKPLKVVYDYVTPSWFKNGTTCGYILPSGSTQWQKLSTKGLYDMNSGAGQLSFETSKLGRLAVMEQGADIYSDIHNSWARSSISSVASVHKLKSVTGSKFYPDRNLTYSDEAKFMLDMLDFNYGSDYLGYAVKAGILAAGDAKNPDAACTREKVIAATVRLYEIKTAKKAKASGDDTHIYKDIGQASSALLPRIRFAVGNGIITSRFSDTLGPKDPVTRAETMVLLEKLLKFVGEL